MAHRTTTPQRTTTLHRTSRQDRPDRADRGAHRHPAGRAQHLIDLENLAGGPFPGRAAALACLGAYLDVSGWQPGDLAVVATNRWLHREIAFDLPSHLRALPVIGKDGADLALLGWTSADDVARRFDRLVVGSGDHAFVDLVAGTTALGTPAWVVGRGGSIARRLQAAATRTVVLGGPAAVAA